MTKLSKKELLEYAKLSSRAKTTSLALRLSAEEFRRLDYLAKQHNTTRSEMARTALRAFKGVKQWN